MISEQPYERLLQPLAVRFVIFDRRRTRRQSGVSPGGKRPWRGNPLFASRARRGLAGWDHQQIAKSRGRKAPSSVSSVEDWTEARDGRLYPRDIEDPTWTRPLRRVRFLLDVKHGQRWRIVDHVQRQVDTPRGTKRDRRNAPEPSAGPNTGNLGSLFRPILATRPKTPARVIMPRRYDSCRFEFRDLTRSGCRGKHKWPQ